MRTKLLLLFCFVSILANAQQSALQFFNPFVGNYIMDAFSTKAFGEITVQHNGLLAVIGITNGKLNQSVVLNSNSDNKPSFFGIYELANGSNEFTQPQVDKEGAFTQLAAELLYRFGHDEKLYVGGRYNTVSGKPLESATENLEISRVNVGGGWFISKNILTKVEYLNQR